MDVGCFLLDRIDDDPVDQAHQRAVAADRLLLGDILVAALRGQPRDQFLDSSLGARHRLRRFRCGPAGLSAVHNGRARGFGSRSGTVVADERVADIPGRGGHRQDLHAGHRPQFFQHRVIHRILDRHDQRAFGFAQRHDTAAVRDGRRNLGEYVEGNLDVEVDLGYAQLVRDRTADHVLIHDAHFLHQDLPDRHRALQGRAPQRHVQYRLRYVAELHQCLAQLLVRAFALEFQRRRQLFRSHDSVLREVLAQILRAQHRLHVQRGRYCLGRNGFLVDQHLPDGRIDAAPFRRLRRHETARDIAVRFRKIKEQTAQRADIAQGHPQKSLAVHQFDAERVAFRTPELFGFSGGCAGRQRFAPQFHRPRQLQFQQYGERDIDGVVPAFWLKRQQRRIREERVHPAYGLGAVPECQAAIAPAGAVVLPHELEIRRSGPRKILSAAAVSPLQWGGHRSSASLRRRRRVWGSSDARAAARSEPAIGDLICLNEQAIIPSSSSSGRVSLILCYVACPARCTGDAAAPEHYASESIPQDMCSARSSALA